MTTSLIAFLIASLLIALFPGPGTALVLRQSVVGGRRAALSTVAGMELGVLVWALAAALGVSVLLTASEIAYTTLRIIGVVVLVSLGVRALRHANKPDTGPAEAPTAAAGIRAGFVVNLANPKLGVFAISFLPQFVPAGPGHQKDAGAPGTALGRRGHRVVSGDRRVAAAHRRLAAPGGRAKAP